MSDFSISTHAQWRASQRNFSEEDLLFVAQYGHRTRGAGVIFCQMRHKDLPGVHQQDEAKRKLVGMTVLLCKCGELIITAYRPKNFREDRQKPKFNKKRNCITCPLECGSGKRNVA